jgi:hypothetical protein
MDTRQQRLEQAIASIQHEYGEDTLRPLGKPGMKGVIPHLSTGFALLDRELGIDGLPKGHLTRITGTDTSGEMTLAYKVLAQAAGEAVVYVDLSETFDEDYAVRCGVDIAALAHIEPKSLHQALETLTKLVKTAAVAILVPDTQQDSAGIDSADLNRLITALHKSQCVLILVEPVGTSLFSSKAAVQLHLERERWLEQRDDTTGYRTNVHIVQNKFGRADLDVQLTIGFSTTVNGDGL